MKTPVTAAVILAAVITFSLIINSVLNTNCEYMTKQLDKIDECIDNEDYYTASLKFNELDEYWEGKEKHLKLIVEHEELDSIDSLFAQLKAALRYRVFEDYFILSSELRFYIDHLIKKNECKIETIL